MNLIKPIKDVLFLVVILFALGILFTTHGILQQVDYEKTNTVTGEVIQIGTGSSQSGGTIEVSPEGAIEVGPQPVPEPEPRPKQKPQPKPQPTNKNLRCWSNAGLTYADLSIVGNLLKTTSCEEPERKREVTGSIEEQCITLDTEGKATTNICVDEPTPRFVIELPTQGDGNVVAPLVKKDYWGLVLLVIALILTFGIWSWDEMRDTLSKRTGFKKYDELELSYGKYKFPTYSELSVQEKEKAMSEKVTEIYEKLLKEKRRRETVHKLHPKEIPQAIKNFNILSQSLRESIRKNDLVGATRYYNDLFDSFLALYNSVHEENKKTILKVVIYFGKQLALLKKSGKISHLINEAYQDARKHKAAVPAKPSTKLMVPEDLDQSIASLQHLLKKSKDSKALKKYKKIFTTLK